MRQVHKRDAAAKLYAQGISRKDVAQTLGISLRTLDRWAADPKFHELIEQHRQALTDQMMAKWERLSAEHAENGETLREIIMTRLNQIRLDQLAGEPISATEVMNLAHALQQAIRIEQQATSMHFRDANVAVAEVLRLGYQVTAGDAPIQVDAVPV